MSGKWSLVWVFLRLSTQLLQHMLFHWPLGEEVVEKTQQSDVWFHTVTAFVLCSRIDSSYASLNGCSGKLLLISNLKDGIDKYRFPSMEKVQTFTHPIDTNCILQTRLLPSWNLIVAGGNDGFAQVFNQISGQLVTEIRHGGKHVPFKGPMSMVIMSSSLWSACTSCWGRACYACSCQLKSQVMCSLSECRLLLILVSDVS